VRRHGRSDGNQREIVEALRTVGATVEDTHALGHGFPDILAGFRRFNWAIEIKLPGAKLTPDESLWHSSWNGQIAVVHSIEEAFELIGLEQNGAAWKRRTAGRS
jgi:hypothetical protein